MNIIFEVIENITGVILFNISFKEKYNISIAKDDDSLTVIIYDLSNGSTMYIKNYNNAKKYILNITYDISLASIYGFSNMENKEFLDDYFITSENILSNDIIDFSKKFI